jgi:uncharacterized membrane protein YgcG
MMSLLDNVFCANGLPPPPRWRDLSSLLHMASHCAKGAAIELINASSAGAGSLCVAPSRVHPSAGRAWPFAVRSGADVVSRFVRREGFWEVFDPRHLFQLALLNDTSPGTLLDVGANLGFYSMTFAKAGWDVIAIEPLTSNRIAFNLSLCLNPDVARRVRVVPAALGNSTAGRGPCVVRSSESSNLGDGVLTCGPEAVPCETDHQQALMASSHGDGSGGGSDGSDGGGGNGGSGNGGGGSSGGGGGGGRTASSPRALARAQTRGSGLCENVRLATLDDVLAELRPARIDAVKIDVEVILRPPPHYPPLLLVAALNPCGGARNRTWHAR